MIATGNGSKTPVRIAVENALVIGMFQFLTLALATLQTGGSLSSPALYEYIGLTSALYGLVAYATARSIALPSRKA